MRARLGVGLVGLVACLGCVAESGPRPSVLDPGVRAAIASAGRGGTDQQVRGRAEEQEPASLDRPVAGPANGKPPAAARVAALVNGQAILEEEVRNVSLPQMASLNGLPEPERAEKAKEIYKKALDTLVEREVVIQEAFGKLEAMKATKVINKLKDFADKEFKKSWMQPIMQANSLKTQEELEDVLEKSGTSLKAVKYGWERNLMSQEFLRNKVVSLVDRVGHQEIEAYYAAHPDEFTVADAVSWQDIFIDAARHPTRDAARKFAESLAQRVRAGEDFVKLAETFDNGDASLRKDALGEGTKRGEIRPAEIEEVVFRLREKDVGPVVEIATGFHVVRLVERTYAGKRPFDEKVQKQIREKLRAELANKEMKRIVNELKTQAVIEFP